MTSFFARDDGDPSDDELHSASDAVELGKTPAHDDALSRLIKLGLSREEAQQVLKG